MDMRRALNSVGQRVSTLPGIRQGLEALFERRFARETPETNLYRGIFPTFAEAQASAPHTRPVGYDNAGAAELYRERTRRVYPAESHVCLNLINSCSLEAADWVADRLSGEPRGAARS